MRTALTILAAAGFVMLVGCDPAPSSDQKINAANETLANEAASQVGVPALTNFQEKRMVKMLYELRDTELKTVSYIVDLNGKLHKVCDSVGFGMPYAVQFSNPEHIVYGNENYHSLPQAEPNGLFMPSTAEGTWVMCLNPADKAVHPVYIEPRMIVSPFPLSVE